DRRAPRGGEGRDARGDAAGAPRRAGRRRRGGTVSLLRRGLVHHGRGAARRRRTGDVMESNNGNGRKRVVVTGVGMVSSLGLDAESSWRSLVAGESGVDTITYFDHSAYPVHFAAELKGFDPTEWMDRKAARRMDRFAQLALAAARQAEADAGFDV